MTTRNYSSTAAATTLSTGINGSTTSMVVAATTGFPAAPFILVVDPEVAGQELVLVTVVAGTTLTVTRGYDSTSAAAHSAGAVVKHAHAAIDFRDASVHQAASTGVHGVTGSVVGTSDTQAVTNKTLGSTNTINGFATSKVMVSDGAGKLAASSLAAPASEILGLTDTQAPTNKDLSSGTNTFPSSLATDAEVTSAVSTHNSATVVHGATGAVVGTTNTQTLTNKTLTSAQLNNSNLNNCSVSGIIPLNIHGTVNTTDWDTPSLATGTLWGPLGLIQIVVAKKAASATVTAGAGGNFADVTVLTGIDTLFRPLTVTGVGRWWTSTTSGTVVLTTSGNILLVDGYPTSTIVAGDTVVISITVSLV